MTVMSLMKRGLVGGVLAVGCGVAYYHVGTFSAAMVLDSLLAQGVHPVTAAMVANGQNGWEMHGTTLMYVGGINLGYFAIYYTLLEKLLARIPAKVYTRTRSGRRVMTLGCVAAIALAEAAFTRYAVRGLGESVNEPVLLDSLLAAGSGGAVQRIDGEPHWVAVPLRHPAVAELGETAAGHNWEQVDKLNAVPMELWALPWSMLALRFFPVSGRIAAAFWFVCTTKLLEGATPAAFLANVAREHADEGDWTRRVGVGQMAGAAGGAALADHLNADFVWLDPDHATMYLRLPEPGALSDTTQCDRGSLPLGPALPRWLSGDRSVEELRAASRAQLSAAERSEPYVAALLRAQELVTHEALVDEGGEAAAGSGGAPPRGDGYESGLGGGVKPQERPEGGQDK